MNHGFKTPTTVLLKYVCHMCLFLPLWPIVLINSSTKSIQSFKHNALRQIALMCRKEAMHAHNKIALHGERTLISEDNKFRSESNYFNIFKLITDTVKLIVWRHTFANKIYNTMTHSNSLNFQRYDINIRPTRRIHFFYTGL